MFRAWLVLLMVAVLAGSLDASIIVLKRDPGIVFTDGTRTDTVTDASLHSPAVITTSVADTSLFMNNPGSAGDWYNYGAATVLDGAILVKFDLAAVADLPGAAITRAELRFHHTAGNNGGTIYRIFTHDWLEGAMLGTASSAYPGAAGGASRSHPMGYNTGPYQDAAGGTPATTTWGLAGNTRFDYANDTDMSRAAKPGAVPGNGWQAFDVKDILETWIRLNNPDPNYGFVLSPGNYPRNSSEAGSDLEPALFIDYTPAPEPAGLALLISGAAALLRRRR